MKYRMALPLVAGLVLGAQDLSKLPDWARPHAEAAARETAPAEADAWVLLDRTEIAYAGDGEIRTRRLRLVKILGERGLGQGTFLLGGLGGGASKVKKLKGWNVRPDGTLEKLDQDTVVTVDSDSGDSLSTDVTTGAVLPRVVKGSVVAFESLQVLHSPIGPINQAYVLEGHPVRRWELEVAKKEGWFTNLKQVAVQMDLRHFAPWIPQPEVVAGQRVAASNLPALPKDERLYPHRRNMLPWVLVRFQDPELKGAPGLRSWNDLAVWAYPKYVTEPLGKAPADPWTALRTAHRWMCRELTYRQVYLRPERGWVPEAPAEVGRKRYGDCKDLASWFIAQARSLGMEAFPVKCRIVEGRIEEDELPGPLAFNHVIAAVRLEKSLGLPAEVEAGGRRFLLVDATDRFTPLGQLHEGHRGRRVMIAAGNEALWAKVPDAAILRPKVELLLEGEVAEQGALEGTLTFRETGNAMGLRTALLQGGAKGLRDHLLRDLLDLPPTAQAELRQQGEPLDGDKPLEVVLKVKHPEGFRRSGSEWTLAPMGLFPQPGTPLAKAGKTRVLPIESEAEAVLDLRIKLRLPFEVKPVLGSLAIDSPFRKAAFKAVQGPDKVLELSFAQERRPVTYGTTELDKGLGEWKKDRSQVRTLTSDGLAFK